MLDWSGYSVVKDPVTGWPNCKVGNYNECRIDGQPDTTSWMGVRNCGGSVCGPSLPLTTTNQFYRTFVDRQWWGSQLWDFPAPRAALGRWVALSQHNSGDINSPQLYSLASVQYTGVFDNGVPTGFPGHRQPNMYKAGYPLETIIESTLRLDRHTAESIIESSGGGQEVTLATWVPMFDSLLWCPQPFDPETCQQQNELAIRPRLMMLRAKNIIERLWFAEHVVDGNIAASWNKSRNLARRVDAPYITALRVLSGTASSLPLSPEQLEYTLRHQGQPRTLDIGGPASSVTELNVEFQGMNVEAAGHENFRFELESNVSSAGATGFLSAFNFTNSTWVMVPLESDECLPDQYQYVHGFPSPDIGCRQRFMLLPDGQQQFVDANGRMLLKVVTLLGSAASTVRHDLLQVVRVPTATCEAPSGGGEDLSGGDQNFDGEDNELDLELFLTRYINDHPGADMDMDGDVDPTDLQLFLDAYTEP